MSVSTKQVAELRRKTGAGLMDCKKALVESDGDINKAIEYLQKKSLAAVGKRAGKVAAEGMVYSYIHDNRIGALVEINCETDFVARGDDFKALVKDVAMQVVASAPLYLTPAEIPAEETAKQSDIYKAQLREEGKPEAIFDKIIQGKLKKWHSEICLMNQASLRDDKKTLEQYVTEVASVIREKIQVRRFVRFELGQGIEKKEENFADEVAAMMK